MRFSALGDGFAFSDRYNSEIGLDIPANRFQNRGIPRCWPAPKFERVNFTLTMRSMHFGASLNLSDVCVDVWVVPGSLYSAQAKTGILLVKRIFFFKPPRGRRVRGHGIERVRFHAWGICVGGCVWLSESRRKRDYNENKYEPSAVSWMELLVVKRFFYILQQNFFKYFATIF